MKESKEERFLRKARVIADFQFGAGAGEALFTEDVRFVLSKTGRISQIFDAYGRRIATLRSSDGLFTLGIEGARRLHRFFKPPRLRVFVNEESASFVRRGKNAFCKHVLFADPGIRAYEEVLVVAENDELLATGKAMLSAEEMLAFKRGVAVKVRQGVEEKAEKHM